LSTKIHMAVRGLGCPVRFTLTAGHRGDAPQAGPLIEDLPAQVVMADAAYDADHLRKAIADKVNLKTICILLATPVGRELCEAVRLLGVCSESGRMLENKRAQVS